MASEGWMMIWNWYGVIFSKFWAMGSKWEESCILAIIWVSYGSKFPIIHAIAMQHFLDLPELWELYGIWTLYYSIEYPY